MEHASRDHSVEKIPHHVHFEESVVRKDEEQR